MKKNISSMLAITAASVLSLLGGCNAFSPVDSPSGDDQILSAARACFDQGDLQCAQDNYAKLSPNDADIAISETAFTMLDQNGAGMNVFIAAFGNGAGGKGLTQMAEKLIPGSAAKRAAIFSAYKKARLMTSGTPLQGLVKFTASIALAAEILAEDATSTPGKLLQADLVRSPATCLATLGNLAQCAPAGNACSAPAGKNIVVGTQVDLDTVTNVDGSPTLYIFNNALQKVNAAFSQIGANGKFSTGTGAFSNALGSFDISQGEGCYRYQLLVQGIGE